MLRLPKIPKEIEIIETGKNAWAERKLHDNLKSLPKEPERTKEINKADDCPIHGADLETIHGRDAGAERETQRYDGDAQLDSHPPTLQQQWIDLLNAIPVEEAKSDDFPIHGSPLTLPGKPRFDPTAQNDKGEKNDQVPNRG